MTQNCLWGGVGNHKIAFSTTNDEESDWNVSTRGTVTTSSNFNSRVSDFRVWGYFSPSASADGATPDGLYLGESATTGAVINGNGSGTWTFANSALEKYWPPTTAPLNFQTITPATDASFTISNTVSNNLPHVVADVTVPTANASQRDIMFASASSQTQSSNDGKVALAFKHAMSAIRFSAKTSASTITAEVGGISLCNIRSTGKVGYLTDNTLGFSTNASPVATFPLGMTSGKVLTTTAADMTNSDGVLIMLPQTTTAWSPSVPVSSAGTATYVALSLKVAYNGVYRIGSSSAYQTVYLPLSVAWQQGKLYTYTLTVGTGMGVYDANGNTLETVPCSFTATSSEWTEENTGVFNPTPAERAPVDLGLPSGTLWAAGNIGAELPWETGLYFAWGETTGYTAAQVAAGERAFSSNVYSSGAAYDYVSTLNDGDCLDLEHDAAHTHLGGNWRMPTVYELKELCDYCSIIPCSNYNNTGNLCYVITSKVNGNELVIPASGIFDNNAFTSNPLYGVISLNNYLYYNGENKSRAYCFGYDTNPDKVSIFSPHCYDGINIRAIIPGSNEINVSTGTENGYEWVDLGLSVKWATCNVGAESPEQAGLYFAWGETTGYAAAQVSGGERAFSSAVYNAGSAASISTDLTPEQDAAHVNMGGKWRMPTKEEFFEMIRKCDLTWTTNYNNTGISGYVYTSKVNENSIFLPAVGYFKDTSLMRDGERGYCFTSTVGPNGYVWNYSYYENYSNMGMSSNKYFGMQVRAVCER